MPEAPSTCRLSCACAQARRASAQGIGQKIALGSLELSYIIVVAAWFASYTQAEVGVKRNVAQGACAVARLPPPSRTPLPSSCLAAAKYCVSGRYPQTLRRAQVPGAVSSVFV